MDAELKFKTTSPPVLMEIVVEDERVRLGPLPVVGERLHKIVELLQVRDEETVWRLEDEERPKDGQRPLVTDKILLDGGTLWIPALGLGLGMVRGEICTMRLRQPGEAPRRGDGSLTASQRELSARKDLPQYLIRQPGELSPKQGCFQGVLGVALAGSLVLLVWQGIGYQRRWNEAPAVEGEVIDVKPPPPDPFPTEYTISYLDQRAAPHQVVLKHADVYVTPHVGDKVEIRFLPEAPDQPMGPARYRDAAFEKYVPWGIGIVAAYLVIQFAVSLVGLLLKRRPRAG
jgi:hypothetical protein